MPSLAFYICLSGCFACTYGVDLATCTKSDFQWANNSLGQDPCVIAAYLGGACVGGFNIPPLRNGNIYLAPSRESANVCKCSSIFYSLIGACSACQGGGYLKWSIYSTNCSNPGVIIYDPTRIPSATRIPHYAYLNVSASNDSFDVHLALQDALGNPPESTRMTAVSLSTKTVSSPSGDDPSRASSVDKGIIIAAVLGGLAMLALVIGISFWLVRRRRLSRTEPEYGKITPWTGNYGGEAREALILTSGSQAFYNPFHPLASHVTNLATKAHTIIQSTPSAARPGHRQAGGYRGLPEPE